MIFLILSIFIAIIIVLVLWFVREITQYEFVNDVSGGHAIPCVKIGMELALSSSEKIFGFPRQCYKKFGRTYRTSFFVFWPALDICEAEDAEIILKSSKHFEKSRVYEILQPFLRTGLLTSNGEKWHQRRRMLTPAFHFDILKEYLEVFRDESNRLVEKLKHTKSEKLNVVPVSTQFTLTTICEAAMGINLADLGDKGKLYKQQIYEIGAYSVELLLKPWLKFDFVKKYTGFNEKLENALIPAHEFTKDIYKQRFANFKKSTKVEDKQESENIYMKSKKRRYAMMDTLLNAQAENLIDEEGILEETDTFTFEGHDTTSAAMTFTLLLLAHHPETQEQLLEEINQTISSTGRSEFMIDDFNKLDLMDRVIKESLRIYPPVHFISRVLSEDVNLKGLTFPKGRLVNIHIFDIHRDPKIFPDPEKFDPDRFLPENSANRNNFAFVAFSAGSRNCIGQKFAMLELKMLLIKIITSFKILPVTKREEIVFFSDIILRTKIPVEMKFSPRN